MLMTKKPKTKYLVYQEYHLPFCLYCTFISNYAL